jgi:hypothetical protein
MFAGERHQRHRGPLRPAHRAAATGGRTPLVVDGQDVDHDVHEVLAKVYAFAEQVRSGEWKGVTGKRIETVVNIGIGGSDLGPVMIYEALQPYVQPACACRFISNIDPTDAAEKTAGPRPRDHPGHRREQDLHHPRDPDQRPAGAAWLLRRAAGLGAPSTAPTSGLTGPTRSPSTSSPSPRRWTRWRLRHRPGQRLRLLGLGRRTLLGRLRDRHRPGHRHRPGAASPSCSPASTPSTSTSARPPLEQRPAADGPAQRLVRQLPRRPQPRRAALRAVPAPVRGIPAAADHGVQRQVGALGRHAGDLRHRRGVLGRAGHQRPARLLPADPPGHPAHPRRLHRGGQPGLPARRTATPTCTSCSSRTSSPRPRRWPSARPRTRCAPRAPPRRSSRPGCSPATGRRRRSWRRR